MKSYKIHLDALVVVVILFVISIGGNLFLLKEYNAAADENVRNALTIMVNEMNLDSKDHYIKKLQNDCDIGSEGTTE
jgi:hypothetical protein